MTGRARAAGALLQGPVVTRSVPWGVPGLIRDRSSEAPDAVAVIDRSHQLTYLELEVASDVVARSLRSAGGVPGDPVVVDVERSCAMVVAMLGAMKAGMPYVPLASTDPPARREALLSRTRARFALVAAGVTAEPAAGVTTVTVKVAGGARSASPEELRPYGDEHSVYVLFTSGSTGEPKGVVVPVMALCNRLLWMRDAYRFAAGDRILQKTPSTFDVSGWEIWGPLISGARCVLMPPDLHRDPGSVVDWVAGNAITVAHFVPSMLEEFLRWPGVGRCGSLRLVVCSGESLPPEYVRRFRERWPGTEFHNLYGPTEAAIDVTYWRCPESPPDRVLIGRPIDNCTLAVVDDGLGPVPSGEVGQLAIGGPVLATGYLHRPDLTAAAFVSAPKWCPVDRLYLTGDLVRRRGDDLEFLGRRDNQLKVRGHRIELAEIEHVLRDQPEVRQAAVVPVERQAGTELCAFVVGAEEREEAELALLLRARLRDRLPDAYVPARILPIAALPLTSSGKLDRAALAGQARDRGYRPAIESGVDDLSRYWSEAIGGEPADPGQGFLTAGGHSLAAARLASHILRQWGVRIPLSALLRDNLSLAALRDRLGEAGSGGDAGVPATGPLDPARPVEPILISPEQRRLWWWTQVFPDSPAYNVVGVLDVTGGLEPSVLARACAALIQRYQVLRTTFEGDVEDAAIPGREPVRQRIHAAGEPVVRHREAGDMPWHTAVGDFARQLTATTFRPDRLPRVVVGLLRARQPQDRSAVVMCLDHLVADQISLDLLLEQLSECYRRAAGPVPATGPASDSPPVQYGDLVRRRGRAEPARHQRDLEFWRRRLRGAPRRLELPFRRARPSVPGFAGAAAEADLGDALRVAGQRYEATAATIALTAYAHTLAAWSGETDLVIGVPISTRELPEELEAVGLFLRTVPIRLSVPEPAGPGRLLAPVADALLEAYEHGSATFDEIVAASAVPRDLSYNPLFQVWFNDLSQSRPPRAFGGHACTPLDPPADTTLFDLGFYLLGSPAQGHRARLVFDTALWEREVAEEFLRQCRANLLSLVPAAAPAGSSCLPSPPRPSEASVPSPPQAPATCQSVVEQVLAHARDTPERLAIVTDHGGVTYRQLEQRLREVSGRVRAAVAPGRPVTVHARREPALAAALLGCWHAGRPPLLLPAEAPVAWTAPADSVAARLDAVPEGLPATGVAAPWSPTAVGHVLSTSGTTDGPALVSLPADALPGALQWYAAQLGLGAEDAFCFTVPPAHDPVFRDLILPLTLGARVRIPAAVDPTTLLATLDAAGATVWHTTPSHATVAVAAGAPQGGLPRLRRVVFHGEPLTDRIAETVSRLAPRAVIYNLYGATETPQASGLHRWRRPVPGGWQEHRASVPAGRVGDPHSPRILTVCGHDGAPVPPGEVGELVVTGEGLALGYLSERPRPAPVARGGPIRAYHTGDLARTNLDGEVEIVGRRDRQVTVHGYRVELAGVERVLAGLPGVRAGAVAPDPRRPAELVAWVVSDPVVSEVELIRQLRAALPEWAVPARIVHIEQIPLTNHGKVDFAALQAAEPDQPPAVRRAPVGTEPLLELLLDLVRTLSPEPARVLPETSFFDAGLTSLLLLRLHDRLAREPAVSVTLPELFRFPTPSALAAHLSGSRVPPNHRRAVAVWNADDTRRQTEVSLRRAARTRHRDAGQSSRQPLTAPSSSEDR